MGKKKLYRKTIVAYVVAESENAAHNVKIDIHASDITVELATESDWGDAIPFGDIDGKSVDKYLEEMKAEAA